jgi:HPt (histidine-containing phosphotransfer) domain-containing protein
MKKEPRMNDAPLFDPSVFRGLCSELGNEDAAEVLQAFLADTPNKMALIMSATADRPSVKRAAHSIKSSAATFGFANLSALARDLESGIEGMSAPQLHACAGTLHRAFEQTAEFAQANLMQPAY